MQQDLRDFLNYRIYYFSFDILLNLLDMSKANCLLIVVFKNVSFMHYNTHVTQRYRIRMKRIESNFFLSINEKCKQRLS